MLSRCVLDHKFHGRSVRETDRESRGRRGGPVAVGEPTGPAGAGRQRGHRDRPAALALGTRPWALLAVVLGLMALVPLRQVGA